jgi:hypothetical protein
MELVLIIRGLSWTNPIWRSLTYVTFFVWLKIFVFNLWGSFQAAIWISISFFCKNVCETYHYNTRMALFIEPNCSPSTPSCCHNKFVPQFFTLIDFGFNRFSVTPFLCLNMSFTRVCLYVFASIVVYSPEMKFLFFRIWNVLDACPLYLEQSSLLFIAISFVCAIFISLIPTDVCMPYYVLPETEYSGHFVDLGSPPLNCFSKRRNRKQNAVGIYDILAESASTNTHTTG